MNTILHTVDIGASADTVFDALTREEDLSGWWTTQVATGVGDDGDEIQFTMVPGFNPRMRVSDSQTGELVRWTCVDGVEEWSDSTFEFRLEEREGVTVLFFTQNYATEISDEEFGRYNFNWGFYLQSLATYCEKGQGIPFDPES
jgi:uncharacterized protein YndB with AHSA1/START domain